MSKWQRKKPRFGFVSTRIAGTDGVSLEAKKWVDVLQSMGCASFFLAGKLDTEAAVSHLAPQAFFQHPEIEEIQESLFRRRMRTRSVSRRVQELKEELKTELETFRTRFEIDLLVVQNAVTIPVNIPLGLAIAEFIAETNIPTIAHHHDFYWERQRFQSPAALDYLRQAFPPVHPCVRHVVINSVAGNELGRRTGVSWTLIPNVLDFKSFPPEIDAYARDFRRDFGLSDDSLLILQPTRVVSRKGIETAIELVRRLDHPRSALVVPHEAGDEGLGYLRRIEDFAAFMGVDLRLIADYISDRERRNEQGRKVYTLCDAYLQADLVTYPSTYEGFGNAFVEAVYFRKPVVVNRYSIFEADIEPKGFQVIAFSSFITDDTVQQVRGMINDPAQMAEMVETNYMLGWRYLSYEMLAEKLEAILTEIYGS